MKNIKKHLVKALILGVCIIPALVFAKPPPPPPPKVGDISVPVVGSSKGGDLNAPKAGASAPKVGGGAISSIRPGSLPTDVNDVHNVLQAILKGSPSSSSAVPNLTPIPSISVEDLAEIIDFTDSKNFIGKGGSSDAFRITDFPGYLAVILRNKPDPLFRAVMNLDMQYLQNPVLRDLTYNGYPIVPPDIARIHDANGNLIGRITPQLPGQTLKSLLALGDGDAPKITIDQMREVQRQLREQIQILHCHGFAMGDIHAGNILVVLGHNGGVDRVSLIDFSPHLALRLKGLWSKPIDPSHITEDEIQAALKTAEFEDSYSIAYKEPIWYFPVKIP